MKKKIKFNLIQKFSNGNEFSKIVVGNSFEELTVSFMKFVNSTSKEAYLNIQFHSSIFFIIQ
jgi:hypothetical protein